MNTTRAEPEVRLARRAVRVLALARFASTGGTNAAQLALAFTIYERTSSPSWVAASLVASAGIVGVLGPISGRLSDRYDRRRVMVAAETAGAVGWLLVLLADSPTTLVAAALVATAANAPFRAASGAAVPNLVSADELAWANGTIATAFNASLVVGPLVGGALLGAAGARAVFGVNVASFLLSAALIARTRGDFNALSSDHDGKGRTSWREVASDRSRARLFAVTALSFGAFGVTLVADLPLVDHFGGGELGYALLTTLWGAGAIAGSSLATRIPPHREAFAVTVGTAAMAVSLGSIAFMPNLPLAIAVGTVGGFGSGAAFTPWFSLLQRLTPDTFRGTAFAMAETFEQISFIIGMIAAGWLVEVLGARPTYVVPGALLAVAAGIAQLNSQTLSSRE